jgi:predicted TIM-barrel fold metal-dependent hydrolase
MIIDFHTHIFPSIFREERASFFPEEPDFELLYSPIESKMEGREDLLVIMEEDGVDRSIVFGFPWRKSENYKRNNDYVIESVRQHPERLIGFCSFDFRSREAPEEAERCLKAGLSGIGELAVYDQGFSRDIITALDNIMEIGVHYDVPVLLHTNEPLGHQYPGKQPMTLNQVYSLLKRYPSNRIVLAHWGGGLFFYGLMKREVKEVLKNVWFDTAASPFLYDPDIYRVAGEILGPEKLLFGSDYPLIRPGRYFKEMESADLTREAMERIKGGNASTLLRL